MIHLIVNLYRAVIGILFVAGVGAAVLLISSGIPLGVLMGIGALIVTIFAVGLSAVLISIHDRLTPAIGPAAKSILSDGSERANTRQLVIGGAAIVATLLVAQWLFSPQTTASTQHAATSVDSSPYSSAPDSNGCVPELAAQVGLSC